MKDSGPAGWSKLITVVGVPTFILLWLLGAFDGILPSPVTAAVRRHDEGTQRVLRLVCRGVWQGDQLAQLECDK